jgi:hypothetical protein
MLREHSPRVGKARLTLSNVEYFGGVSSFVVMWVLSLRTLQIVWVCGCLLLFHFRFSFVIKSLLCITACVFRGALRFVIKLYLSKKKSCSFRGRK